MAKKGLLQQPIVWFGGAALLGLVFLMRKPVSGGALPPPYWLVGGRVPGPAGGLTITQVSWCASMGHWHYWFTYDLDPGVPPQGPFAQQQVFDAANNIPVTPMPAC